VIFLDNHDIARFYSVVGEDTSKYKMAFAWLLTSRGIPQMYYGSEILMTGFTSPNDGYVRWGFPGGWEGDPANKFTPEGRNKKENRIFNYIRTLANYRKSSSALTKGKCAQYLPVDGVYVYFRFTDQQKVMCIMNTNAESSKLNLDRFVDHLGKASGGKNVVTGEVISLKGSVELMPYTNLVLELTP
jgi:glycosidase